MYQRGSEEASYRQLKATIDASYPQGWFVAISGDQVVAAAASFREVKAMLRAQGKDPRSVLVVEAGVDYPEHLTIFA